GQPLEHALRENEPALFRLRLQNLEYEFLLAEAGGSGDAKILCNLIELLDAHVLQLDQIEGGAVLLAGLGHASMAFALALLRRRSLLGRLSFGLVGSLGFLRFRFGGPAFALGFWRLPVRLLGLFGLDGLF